MDNNYRRSLNCGNCRFLLQQIAYQGDVIHYDKTCPINPSMPVRYTDGYEHEYVCDKHQPKE